MPTQTSTQPIRKRCTGERCGREILIVQLTTGNKMPIDPEPTPEGRLRRLEDGRYEVLGAAAAEKARRAGERLWQSHFVGCPQGPQLRKGRRS